ncbi:MAG: LytR C-terminal domain-containing protein, partial [Solirubrobacteraceae bacterium]
GPAGRRPAAKPPGDGRSAGTIALIVGLAVLILGGGTFVVSQLIGGDDTPAPPNRAAPPPTQTSEPDTDGNATPAPPAGETNVAVLNGTTSPGLAGQLADRVAEEGGYQRGITDTNTRNQTLQSSTVYYADGFRGSARAVARLFSVDAVEPLDADTRALAPEADVVVLAGADQAP